MFLRGIGEVGGTLRRVTEHSLPRVVESPEWDWPFIVLSSVPASSLMPRRVAAAAAGASGRSTS